MIKLMYSVFLGLTLVIFIGVGVSTFYPAPEGPEYPEEVDREMVFEDGELSPEAQAKLDTFEEEDELFWEEERTYNRNIAIITMAFAVGLLVFAVTKAENFEAISEGVLLGGVFTLLYSLIRGLMAGDDITRFMVIAAGLAIALWLGFTRFGHKAKEKKSSE